MTRDLWLSAKDYSRSAFWFLPCLISALLDERMTKKTEPYWRGLPFTFPQKCEIDGAPLVGRTPEVNGSARARYACGHAAIWESPPS